MSNRLPGHGFVLALAVGLSLPTGSALADPPQFNGLSPLGVQRGVATELTITGSNLADHPELIAPFPFVVEGAPSGDASKFKLKLTVASDVAVGTYPVRVKTDDGISGPLLMAVGQVPQVAENEPNNNPDSAHRLPETPLAIDGQASGNDVDYYRFSGRKGQQIVVDAVCARIGSGVDPQIRLTTAAQQFVASADDTPGLMTDARLVARLPEDGDYILEFSDSKYQGSGRTNYRLVLGPLPVADEIFPIGGRHGETVGFELRGGTLGDSIRVGAARVTMSAEGDLFRPWLPASALGLNRPGDPVFDLELAQPLAASDLPELREPVDPNAPVVRAAVPVVYNGRIDPAGDEDRLALAVTPGQAIQIVVEAAAHGSALDGVLQVLKPDGGQLASADDTTAQPNRRGGNNNQQPGIISPDPSLNYNVPSGTTEIILALRDLEGRGGVGFPYRIRVEPALPGFSVELSDAQVSVPRGGSAAVAVTLTRRNFNGPVTITLVDPPKGLTVRPGTIAAGQTAGVFSVAAAPDASFGAVTLQVVGQAEGPNGPITSRAGKEIVYAQQGNFPIHTEKQIGLAAAPAQTIPITLETPSEPVQLVHGLGGPIPIKIQRGEGADSALSLAALPLPAGVTVPNDAKIAEKATEGSINVTVATDAAVGVHTIGLTAKGKLGGKERTVSLPAVTIDVVRPVAVELEKSALEIKAGETVELKGKVVRKGGFKEPVTLKITGLPAGLKAEPITLAPEVSEFTAKIIADANASAAMENALAAANFQVNKKDYPAQSTGFAIKVVK